MANKKISQAASKASLEATDMIPVAQAGSTTAFHITGENLFGSLPAATDAAKGAVELATQAETAAVTDTERAVTPASLVNAIGPKNLAVGHCFIGVVIGMTRVNINAAFLAKVGRVHADGDLIALKDELDNRYILLFDSSQATWWGMQITNGTFVHFS
jgi:hypothetical protein